MAKASGVLVIGHTGTNPGGPPHRWAVKEINNVFAGPLLWGLQPPVNLGVNAVVLGACSTLAEHSFRQCA